MRHFDGVGLSLKHSTIIVAVNYKGRYSNIVGVKNFKCRRKIHDQLIVAETLILVDDR